ncbi:MAG: hypothetical protein ACLFUH_04560 [Bacteroidales bacterium]
MSLEFQGVDIVDEEEFEKIKENQQEILQTLNNGLKSKVEENNKGLNDLESRFNKLLLTIGAGMFAIILMLIEIMINLSEGEVL